MPIFDPGQVVRVPFPYTDRSTRQRRPALVVSAPDPEQGLLWVVMITSAENARRPGDIEIGASSGTGLPVASLIRTARIATIESRDAERLGRAPLAVTTAAMAAISARIGRRRA